MDGRTARSATRALAVVLGPSLIADGFAVASCAATARAARARRRPAGWACAGVAATALYAGVLRPRMLRWGATAQEAHAVLPADELVPGPAVQSTRAITIDAPPAEVWGWLAQIGQDRGGFYSYAWLENLAGCRMRNAVRVHPEWQERRTGEIVLLHPLNGLPVARFEERRLLALEGWGAFVLQPLPGGRTRLLARGRTPYGVRLAYGVLLIEIPHFVMERAMLRGIRRRAERAASGNHADLRPGG